MKQQVSARHYRDGYLTKARFASFWYQTREVLKFNPRVVLEIGPGPGVVTSTLRTLGIEVHTCDLADDVSAEVLSSVTALPFADRSFDVVLCCQVLEHVTFPEALIAIAEIRRVSAKGVVISVPHAGRFWPFSVYLPRIGNIQFGIDLQFIGEEHRFDGQHQWELGKRGYSPKRLSRELRKRFTKVETFRPVENPYHRFFTCA